MDHTGDVADGGVLVALMDVARRGAACTVVDGQPVVDFDLLADDRDRDDAGARGSAARRPAQPRPPVLAVERARLLDQLGDVFHAAGTCRMGDGDALSSTSGCG